MISATSRIFQAGLVPDPEVDRPSESEHSNARTEDVELGATHPVLSRKPSSTINVAVDYNRSTGPSHVSWKSPSTQNSPASASANDLLRGSISNSISSPSSSLGTTSTSATITPRANGYRASSSLGRNSEHSLLMGFDHAEGEVEPDRDSIAVPEKVQPTPQEMHFPPQRQPSVDSFAPTPDSLSVRVSDGHASNSQHPAFITRQLKRSISQTSTSTFLSTASGAPTIPPLDLRPTFPSGTLGVPASQRKSRFASPISPGTNNGTVNFSRPLAKVSVIYEDGASSRTTASFITAPSVHTPDLESDHAPSGLDTATESTTDARDAADLPEGLYDIPLSPRRPPSVHSHSTASASWEDIPTPLFPRPRAPRPASSSASESESFLHKRWLKGVSFGSTRFVVPPAPRARVRMRLGMSSACVLFWLGFVGPWCWLVGGWLMATDGAIPPEGKPLQDPGPLIPLWTTSAKGKDSDKVKGKGKEVECMRKTRPEAEGTKTRSWYPLVAPSVDSLTHSRTSITSLRTPRKGQTSGTLDPWVVRCRLAAVTSGTLLLGAFIVAVIVVAGVQE